ncbi:MAG: hypothetical protein NZ900_01640 [Synergistetes bacterium]|nr:hypothetical protein [Synergistota bacterium]MDW8191629.1 hypothetical protein [Synergistota bacterium]
MIDFIKAGMKSEEYICNTYTGTKETLDKIKEEIESIPFLNRGSYRRIDLYVRELKDKLGGDIFPSDVLPLVSYAFPQEQFEEIGEDEEDKSLPLSIEVDKLLIFYMILRYHPFKGMIVRRLISRGINASFFLKSSPGEMVRLIEFLALADAEAVEEVKRCLSSGNFLLIDFGTSLEDPRVKSILSYPYLVEFEMNKSVDKIINKLKGKIFLNSYREELSKAILFRLSALSDEGRALALIGQRGVGKSTLISSLLKESGWPFFSISLSPGTLDELFGSHKEPGLLFKGTVSCGVINPCMIFEDIETPSRKAEKFLFQIVDPYNRQEIRDRFTKIRLFLGKAPVFLVGTKLNKKFDHPSFKSNVDVYELPPFKPEEFNIILSDYILPKVISKMKASYRKILEPLKEKEAGDFLIDILKERQSIKGGYTLDGLERAVEKLLFMLISKKGKKITLSEIKKLTPLLKEELGGERL